MPLHTYTARRHPPSWWDRVLAHPVEHAVALIALVFGVLMTIVYPATGEVPSPAFTNVPWLLNVLAGTSLLAGGGLSLTGLHWPGRRVTHGWAVELLGWALTTGGLAAVALAFAAGASPSAWLIPGILTLGALTRWLSLWMIIQRARIGARVAEQVQALEDRGQDA